MKPHDEKNPNGGKADTNQQREEQAHVGGASKGDFDSQTGRHGASEDIAGTEQPGEEKQPTRE